MLALSGCRWSSSGQNTLGVQMFQQGRYAEALQQFDKAKQVDPSNPDAYYNLASTYHKLGSIQNDANMLEQAEALYNQCLDVSPNHADCHRGLAVLLVETNRPDSGFTLLKNWASNNQTLADPRIELSRLYQEFGDNLASEQYLDEALAMAPNNYKVWAAKGRIRESKNDLQQAIQDYQQSLAINSYQPELYQRVAALNIRLTEASFNNMTGAGATRNAQIPGTTQPRY
jgi:tetratricopeptide (TPR) repeat protein